MSIFPFIKLIHVYNDDNAEKYERPFWVLPELIESFAPFEILYNGNSYTVKEDDKQIKRKIKDKLEEMRDSDIKGETDE